MKFCFVCGKKNEKLIEGYCEDCYNQKFKLVKVPESIDMEQCSKCNRIKHLTSWQDMSVEDVVKSKIKTLGKDITIKIEGKKIIVKGTLENSKKSKEEEHEVRLNIRKFACPECCRRLGGYYETLIQLRGEVTSDILDLIDKKIMQSSFYKTDKVTGGYNLYVGDKTTANQVADFIDKKYRFKIRRSYKLFTKKDGRNLYKCIILIYCD
jgi:NMD protein affecting ribosome stability and mRNA decay